MYNRSTLTTFDDLPVQLINEFALDISENLNKMIL